MGITAEAGWVGVGSMSGAGVEVPWLLTGSIVGIGLIEVVGGGVDVGGTVGVGTGVANIPGVGESPGIDAVGLASGSAGASVA